MRRTWTWRKYGRYFWNSEIGSAGSSNCMRDADALTSPRAPLLRPRVVGGAPRLVGFVARDLLPQCRRARAEIFLREEPVVVADEVLHAGDGVFRRRRD